jgi:hypothetical protein
MANRRERRKNICLPVRQESERFVSVGVKKGFTCRDEVYPTENQLIKIRLFMNFFFVSFGIYDGGAGGGNFQ